MTVNSDPVGWMAERPIHSVLIVVFLASIPSISWQYITYGSIFIGAWGWDVNSAVVTIQMVISIVMFSIGVLVGIRVSED